MSSELRSTSLSTRLRNSLPAYLFLLPALIIYGTFVLWPIIDNLALSLTSWRGGTDPRQFVGLRNYTEAFRDPLVLLSLQNNLVWIAGVTVGVVGLALLSAVVLWTTQRGRLLFRTVFFMPAILSLVVTGIIWNWIYNPVFGILNRVFEAVGLPGLSRGWLGDSETALFSVIVTKIWQGFGWSMVLFLAGLMSIDPDLLDAARIDGTNAWQRFVHVTLPQLRHVTTVVTLIAVIAGFKVFDIIFVMTQGGPGNRTLVMSIYVYRQAFKYDAPGYGAAVSVILTAIIMAVSVVYIRLREQGE
jgi:raffinose/stachyose/melibiose transport system permease protein